MDEKETRTEKSRSSNFELLRIIAMFGIILCHCCTHGFSYDAATEFNLNIALGRGMTVLGICGNYIFMLISGYFLCTSNFTWKKFFNIWIQMFFWTTVFTSAKIGFDIYSGETLSSRDLFGYLPVLSNASWYASSYLIFYVFLPFLNKLTENLNRKEHLTLTVILLVLGSIITNLYFQSAFRPGNLYNFIMLYFVAAYIRKYAPEFSSKCAVNLFSGIGLIALYFIFVILIYLPGKNLEWNTKVHLNLAAMMLFAPASIFIFCGFKNLNIGSIKAVNFIASLTFGIYLIHDNSKLRPVLWNKIIKPSQYSDRKDMILIFLGITAVIFIVCGIMECCRIFAFWIISRIRKTGKEK